MVAFLVGSWLHLFGLEFDLGSLARRWRQMLLETSYAFWKEKIPFRGSDLLIRHSPHGLYVCGLIAGAVSSAEDGPLL